MKRLFSCILAAWMGLSLLYAAAPAASAKSIVPDLTPYISNRTNRHFVESMLSYHLRENTLVQNTLEEGLSAVFLFEGCSDNMDNPTFSDISYYRVSAVCIVLKLDETGTPVITYFNENSSTIPDKPLEYGAWELEGIGDVGPATVCDGTYELYSVYHAGAYEALNVRTTYEDKTVAAVYMTPDGFTVHPATYINIHTRNVNHALKDAMWSAGCMLVGGGDFNEFAELIVASYYSSYGKFVIDRKVGTVTVNRQYLKESLNDLYKNEDAVRTFMTSSRCELPEVYLERCSDQLTFEQPRTVRTLRETELMSLPCSNDTDARSIPVTLLSRMDVIDICGQITNHQGELWYEVDFIHENCYIRAEAVEEIPQTWMDRISDWFHGI